MSMNPEQDNFQPLQRLLALKRYEQPPPGYFDQFSTNVVARLRAGERGSPDSLWEWLSLEAAWLQRFWHTLETKPVFAGALGAGVCGLLLAGILYSQSVEPAPVAGFMSGVESAPTANPQNLSNGGAMVTRSGVYDLSNPGSAGAIPFRNGLLQDNQQPWSPLPVIERASYSRPLGSQ